MSQQILVNTSPYETRVALLENGEIRQLHIEREEDRNVVGNVYLGVVKRVLPGMQAAFLELGLERTAFLYVDDIIQEPLGDVEIISPDDESGGEGSSGSEEDWGDDDDADDGWDEETTDDAPADEDEEVPGDVPPEEGAAPAEAEEEGPEEKWIEGDPDKPVREARGPRDPDDRSGRGPRRDDDYDDRSDRPAPGNERERYDSRGDYRGEAPARDDRPRRGGPPVGSSDRPGGGGGRGGRGGGGEARGRDEGRRNEPPRDRQDRGPRPERDVAPREGGRDSGGRGGRDRDADRGGDRGGRGGRDEGRGRGPSEADDAIYTEARQVERSRERAREYVDDSERSPDRDRDRERMEPRSPERGDRNGERGGSDRGGRGRRDEGRGSEAKERAPEGRSEGRNDRNDEPRRASGGGGGRDRERGGRGGRGRRGGGGGGGGGSSSRDSRGGGSRGRRRHMPRKPRVTANIQDLLKEGQEILVQVAKAPIGTKGARLTTHISLPGRNLVLMPTVKHIGISRRIESDRERRRLRDIFTKRIQAPGVGFIVRTVAEGKSYRELRADADYLIKMWAKIQKESKRKRAPSLIHEDLSLGMRAVRDLFTDDVDQFIIDNEEEFHRVSSFIGQFMPRLKARVKLYKGPQQLFEHYGIEAEISRALGKKVWLKSGGYLLVDQSEALTAIDVNTGRYVGSKSLEETILKTNLEAVKEIAYQLRIRNVGGIIIIDLIDMESMENREKVFHALQEALGEDRARTNILKISDLGLVEMTRKRTHEDLVRYLTEVCAYCEGRGYHKSQRTVCFEIFREVEKESSQPGKQIVVFANPQVAGRLLHEEKKNVEQLEKKIDRMISVRPDPEFHIEQYEVFAKQ